MIKQTKGITLIALIITIIVLLILAGVTINMVLGENGLFNKAKTSVAKYENAQEKENSALAGYEAEIDNNSRETTITMTREELENLIETKIIESQTLDYEHKVDISSYKTSSNQYTFPKNGVIQVWGTGGTNTGWMYIYINDTAMACLQTKYQDSYSTTVNKNDKVYFESHTSSWSIQSAYFIPYK